MERVYNSGDLEQVKRVVNQVASQVDGNTGTVNLASSTTTTTVNNPIVHSGSKIVLQPRNANAASAGAFISSVGSGSFVIGHASATTTRTFDYVVHGV